MEQDEGPVKVTVFTANKGTYTKAFSTAIEARDYLETTKDDWFDFTIDYNQVAVKKAS